MVYAQVQIPADLPFIDGVKFLTEYSAKLLAYDEATAHDPEGPTLLLGFDTRDAARVCLTKYSEISSAQIDSMIFDKMPGTLHGVH